METLKNELKALAASIKENKLAYRKAQSNFSKGDMNAFKEVMAYYLISRLSWDFRHKHIVYCLLNGTPMDKIEKPAKDNLPNEKKLAGLMEIYRPKPVEETPVVEVK